MPILHRPVGSGTPLYIGDLFRLQEARHSAVLEASCRLLSHPLGWELQLEVAGSLQRSQVCRSQDEVLITSDQWKAAMLQSGWLQEQRGRADDAEPTRVS